VKPFPLVLSSPSGGGKTTIAKALVAARDDVGYSISATTRPPRRGEVDGKDYFFLSRDEFERRVAAGDFVEWAEYSGHRYGTLKEQVRSALDGGRHVVLDIEVVGARAMKAAFPDAVLVFVVPPSADELWKRIGGTEGDRAPTLLKRLHRAVEELREAGQYDYVVVNADRTEAVAEVAAILDAESRRPGRNPDLQADLLQLARDITALEARLSKQKKEG
jgi:guanylate kinase